MQHHLPWFHIWLQWVQYCVSGNMIQQQIPTLRCYYVGSYRQDLCSVTPCIPQWNLHLVLFSLLRPLFATAGDRQTDSQFDLKWQTLKPCFLLATAYCRSFIHALSVALAHLTFRRGDVDGQYTVSLMTLPALWADDPSGLGQLVGWQRVVHTAF